MIELLKKIEYALRKDSLTDNERVASARALVCAAISKAEYSGVAQGAPDHDKIALDAARSIMGLSRSLSPVQHKARIQCIVLDALSAVTSTDGGKAQ